MKIAMIAMAAVMLVSTEAFAKNCGGASWYSLPHNRTANGERMNPNAHTAAHRSLKFGTHITVVNQRNGKSVVVRVNDRGPFVRGRILDLSKAAGHKIGIISSGHGKVCYYVGGEKPKPKKKKTLLDFFRKS